MLYFKFLQQKCMHHLVCTYLSNKHRHFDNESNFNANRTQKRFYFNKYSTKKIPSVD